MEEGRPKDSKFEEPPHSVDKSPDEKSGDIKSGEKSGDVKSGEKSGDVKSGEKSGDVKSGEGKKSGEGSIEFALAELTPKHESVAKFGEKKTSSEERRQSLEENVSKEGDVKKATKIDEKEEKQRRRKKSSSIWKMLILILINILNYLDRFTVAGVLTSIQAFYDINDAQGGLLYSAYMISSTLIAPVWGYFGDRYNRKNLMTAGLVLWTCTVLLSTFTPKDMFWLFVFSRFVISLGQTCFTVMAPCVIADMFVGGTRSCMYMLFYFAVPLGSGLGHIIAGRVAAVAGNWTWGVRVTFVLGVVCILLITLYVEEPKRGAAEEEQGQLLNTLAATTYCEDLKSLSTNLTYVFSTAAYTAIVFTIGALSWWVKVIIVHDEAHTMGLNYTHLLPSERKNKVDAIFGAVTLAGGMVGIALGPILSMLLRYGVGPSKCVQTRRSDSIICGIGSLLAAPLVYFLLHFIPIDMMDAWITMFFVTTVVCFSWPLIVDLLMDITIPPRRCVATSWQMVISHAFGDVSSPYVIGMISDALRGDDSSPGANFESLLTAMYLADSSSLISAILFFCAAYTFTKDNRRFRRLMGVLDESSQSKDSDAPRYDSKQLVEQKLVSR